MSNANNTLASTKNKTMMLTTMGLLTAIVVVLQAMAIAIRFGVFNITLVLVPIVVGAALYGWKAGSWLGFVFRVVVLFSDAGAFLAINVPGTIITVLLKGTLAGAAAGLIYSLLSRKNDILGVIGAGIVSPIVNTGNFLIGCLVFFYDTIAQWAAGAGFENVGVYMVTAFVGLNFVVELAINLVLSSAIVLILKVAKKHIKK